MSRLLLILLLGIIAAQVNGQRIRFFQDTIAYVWAEGGLNMRDADNLDGKRITTIPYGAKVKVFKQQRYGDDSEYTVTFYSDQLKLPGYFIKVSYSGLEGYVFSEFLSDKPAFRKMGDDAYQSLQNYLEEHYKFLDRDSERQEEPYYREVDNFYYKSGMYIQSYSGEGGGETFFWLPNWSYGEGLLFLKRYFEEYGREENKQLVPSFTELSSSVIHVDNIGPIEGYIKLQIVPGGIIIAIGGWC